MLLFPPPPSSTKSKFSKLGVLPPRLLRRRQRLAPDARFPELAKVQIVQVDLLEDGRVGGADVEDGVAVVAQGREGGPLDDLLARGAVVWGRRRRAFCFEEEAEERKKRSECCFLCF